MLEPIKIIIRDDNGQATGIDQYGQVNKTGKQPYEVIEDKINEIVEVVNNLMKDVCSMGIEMDKDKHD